MLRDDLRPYRDELVISTKAGYDMWPGPYGEWGSRKYLLASLDQSLARMGLDYVDIFYSHRFDPETPLEETMGALDTAVRQGKALYAGISSYSSAKTREAAAILRALGTPLLIHQPSYSMLNRWIEPDLLDTLEDEGIGCIGFSPLAQGMLTDRYLDGIPAGSRASENTSLPSSHLDEQTLAQGARPDRDRRRPAARASPSSRSPGRCATRAMTSLVVGASSVGQLETNVAALDRLELSAATSWRRSTGSRRTRTSISGRSRAAGSRVPEPRTRSEAVAPQKPEVEKPTGDIPFELDRRRHRRRRRRRGGRRQEGVRALRRRRVLDRRGVRRLVESRSGVLVQARQGPGDSRAGMPACRA